VRYIPGARSVRVLTIGNMFPPASIGGYELIWRSAVDHLRKSGHEVRVLTSDHGADAVAEEDGVHRRLRLYWQEFEFPSLSLAERLRLERANATVFDAELEDLKPDVVSWWAMGGMSLSLIERTRRAGLPAVGVVGDDWMLYGPRVDGWTRTFARPVLGPIASRLTGVPASRRFGPGTRWLFISETLRGRATEAGALTAEAEVVHRGADELFTAAPPNESWGGRLLYIGRIDPRKGIDTALESLARF
jgi:glycogen synthase